ncbi:hypothetical protein OHA37_27595 [Streptomyces sp. NBC_00335]|uniref:hypothetical protein n=1 Tax=unclassified Streptomyces TaxID=2593676 RepID=UPI00225982EE|nr:MULTISPECIES: hypothetical protein [unclassified Streptomyces]MCX5407614.1 hypothetical protein [Streptomyces sp. NBC_00086]
MPLVFPRAWHRPLMVLAASMALWAAGSAIGLLVDARTLVGAPIWSKPLKFAVSLTGYALSLAWMISLLERARPRLARPAWWAGTVVAAASGVEMVLITAQAFRGRQSHFNYATPFDARLYEIMAGSIVVLWLGALVIAVLLFRARIADRATTWSIRIAATLALAGAGLGFLMTQPTAAQRAVGDDGAPIVGGHAVGVPDGGPGMPLTGWSTTGGDLRVPHFVGMHALQLLPLFVLVLAALAARFAVLNEERVRLRLVLVAGAVYGAVLALLTWQALRGQSLTSPDGTTLGAAGLILAAAALGTLLSLRRGGGPGAREGADPAGPGSVPRSSVRSSAS